ncbi:hypothetical protein J6590_031234 [Homalodisca vitripennis]|nr:hypothetical protein J6590_031234 [Homalodisca vitripennis]
MNAGVTVFHSEDSELPNVGLECLLARDFRQNNRDQSSDLQPASRTARPFSRATLTTDYTRSTGLLLAFFVSGVTLISVTLHENVTRFKRLSPVNVNSEH